MQTKTHCFRRSGLTLLTLGLFLFPRLHARNPIAEQNIINQLEGDTDCIVSAKRYWYTWSAYNDVLDKKAEAGKAVTSNGMRDHADAKYRTSWKVKEYRPRVIALPTGSVDGEENTRFGAIPRTADIQAGYFFDWKVKDYYGWGSHYQPRVESVTVIKVKEDKKATLQLTNKILMTAKGKISGTDGASAPWPQIGKHEAKLLAVDIKGKQHRLEIHADATAMPSSSKSSGSGESSTTGWSVSSGVSVAKSGPSVSIGGSYSSSRSKSTSKSEGSSVPTVEGASYKDHYEHTTSHTVSIDCGKQVELSRAAHIIGDFYTKSMAKGGSVSTKGGFAVSNTLKIKVICEDCGKDPDDEGDPDEDPSGGNNPGPGNGNGGGAQTNPFGSKPHSALDPRSHGTFVITPVDGDTLRPNAFPDAIDDLIAGGGCIYIDPRFVEGMFTLIDPANATEESARLPEDTIPLVVPRSLDNGFVAIGHIQTGSMVRPHPGTRTEVVSGLNRVFFHGPWSLMDGASDQELVFGPGYIDFPTGGEIVVNGPYEVTSMAGTELQSSQIGLYNQAEALQPETGALVGRMFHRRDHSGNILFGRSVFTPDAHSELELEIVSTEITQDGLIVTATGERERSYELDYSGDLVFWEIGDNLIAETGTFHFLVPNDQDQEFFRIRMIAKEQEQSLLDLIHRRTEIERENPPVPPLEDFSFPSLPDWQQGQPIDR